MASTWSLRSGALPESAPSLRPGLRGLAWLLGSSAVTVASGWALQVLAIHRLDAARYSALIFALAAGSIAAILGSAIQPALAASILRGEGTPGGRTATLVVGTAAAAAAVLFFATAAAAGPVTAAFACVQLPIHALIGLPAARLQARGCYASLGAAAMAWTGGRIAFALGGSLVLPAHTAFVLALPAALSLQLAYLAAAERRAGRHPAAIRVPSAVPWRSLAAWCAVAWIVFGDGVMALVLLAAKPAADYGLALTLGRQAMYVAVPLATLLLPLAATSGPRARRRLFLTSLGTLAVVAAVLGPALGAFPGETARLLLLDPAYESLTAVRLYAAIGTASFAALLFASFLAGTGARLPLVPLAALALIAPATMVLFANSAAAIGAIQALASAATALLLLCRGAALVWRPGAVDVPGGSFTRCQAPGRRPAAEHGTGSP